MSLRRRVLLGFAVVAIVLIAGDVILAATFQSFLLGRVDSQLEAAAVPLARSASFRGDFRGARFPSIDNNNRAITEYFIAVINADGSVATQVGPGLRPDEPAPRLSASMITSHARPADQPLELFTSRASSGSGTYRMVAISAPDGDTLVMAISLREMAATYHRMLTVEAAATVLVLLAQAAVAFWVLRLGIRPLAAMADTAQAIAAGDMSQRVAHAEERTEAGQLGIALNAMLEQIEEAFRQRAASEDRLRRFVADASHELRTPLTSIRGYAELWRQGGLNDTTDLAEAMRRMEQEAARMGVLVEDLLLLARLDQGRPLEMAPLDMRLVVSDAVADARVVEPDRPIDLHAEPVSLVGDEHRLRQVVGNLLANARMHTPTGTPVHVSLRRAGDRAILEVADQGPGLDAETAARVFERFYRADAGRTRARGGSGLGLSIVAAVAEAHGGNVRVSSTPGHGAVFTVELPTSPARPGGGNGNSNGAESVIGDDPEVEGLASYIESD